MRKRPSAASTQMSGAPTRRWRSRIARYVLIGALLAWAGSTTAVLVSGARDGAGPADAIVVMGAAQYAGRPSPVLKARLDHAMLLWKRGLASWLIVTGGMGSGDTTSEAAVGRRYALRHGVPDSAILLEDHGRTTTASLAGVSEIMSRRQLRRAILVSDPFHTLRLRILARQYGLDCVTSPTRTSPISASRTEALGYVMSESVKVPITLILTAFGSRG